MLARLWAAHAPGGELAGVGLRGRLGDLGAVEARLDVAVSTACSALDCVVVDSAEDAQRCVEFLKRHSVGRARFLILEKMESRPAVLSSVELSAPPWRPPSPLPRGPSASSTACT